MKNNFNITAGKDRSSFPHGNDRASFTLIELMVVMLIIAILAGITYPVVMASRRRAMEQRAEAEVRMIQAAIKQYVALYRKWPAVLSHTNDSAFTNANQLDAVIRPLVEPDHPANPRRRVFLRIQENSIVTNGGDMRVVDPWGNNYWIFLDTDYDGLVSRESINTNAIPARENDAVNNPLINKSGGTNFYTVYCGWVN